MVDALRRLRALLCCCCALLLWTCARKTWRQMLQQETYIRGVTRPASSHERWSARICLASAGRIAAGSTSSSMPLRHTAGGIDSIAALDHEPIHSMSQRVYRAGLDSQRSRNEEEVGSIDSAMCTYLPRVV